MKHSYSFEQFAAVRNFSDLSFSPDGRWVTYVANTTGQLNVWKQPVRPANHGHPAAPLQLTALQESAARRAVWSPDGSRILTSADFQGTENYQLFQVPADDGWLYPLTDNPATRNEMASAPFSPDGQWVLFGSNQRDPVDMDVFIQHIDSGERRMLLGGGGYYFAESWSPDGLQVLAGRFHSNMNQDLYVIDVASGAARHLTPHEGEIKFFPAAWAADSSGFYFLSDEGRSFTGLGYCDLESGARRWVETPAWDVEASALARNGRYLAWLVNEDGYSRLYVRDLTDGAVHQFPGLPEGVYSSLTFSPDATLLGLYITRPSGPANLTLLDLESGENWALTQSFLGGVPAEIMVTPQIVRYESHDGRQIPAFLYRPRDLAPGQRVPVVLSIHGGPQAQERPLYNYNGFYQYLLHRGIGILATNIRGSTGYGKEYEQLINRDWGGDELKDLEHAARYLQSQDWVAPDRIGVFGGSFGGFATLSCVTRLPQYWAAAVDIVGPSNLVTFTKAVPPHWRRFMKEWVGDPEEEHDFLMARSPISYVNNVEAPLLIIQGANDPRVVKAESDQIVAQLQQLGREIDYMVFEDEGHGFSKTANWLKALGASAAWFEKHLRG